jgi:hypothetical protein
MRNGQRVWLIAGLALLSAVVLVVGVLVGLRLGGRTHLSVQSVLATDFARLEPQLHAEVGIALSAVGGGGDPITLGDWHSGPAWSTIKVPLVIAALREQQPPVLTDAMRAAITESDNAAAESIWAGLGDPAIAARKVDAVLRQAGDPTTVQSQRVRPGFSAFGQTEWPLTDQVQFISVTVCDKATEPVLALMGQVTSDQRWGIGTLPDSRFKGGWGPSPSGSYVVRQMGVLTGSTGMIAVALAAQPSSGKFDDGVAAVTEMAKWLTAHLSALPAGHCDYHK